MTVFEASHRFSDTHDESFRVELLPTKQLLFACAVDVSGSMAGAKSRAAVGALGSLMRDVMRDTDLVGLCTFAGAVRRLFLPMARAQVDWPRAVANMEDNSGGSTALWDGVFWAIDAAQTAHRTAHRGRDKLALVTEVLVITDGQENASSQHTFEEVCEKAWHPGIPNFNLTIIGVGADVDRRSMMRLCDGARHCRFVFAEDVQAFQTMLTDHVERVRMTLRVHRGPVVSTTTTTCPKSQAPRMMKSMADSGASTALTHLQRTGQLQRITAQAPLRQLQLPPPPPPPQHQQRQRGARGGRRPAAT